MAVLHEPANRNPSFLKETGMPPCYFGIPFHAHGDDPLTPFQDRHETVWSMGLPSIRFSTPSAFDHGGGKMYQGEDAGSGLALLKGFAKGKKASPFSLDPPSALPLDGIKLIFI
jgi:hypothetical protein